MCVRHGRLAGTTVTPVGADPMPHIAALRATAEVVDAGEVLPEETELILRWLEEPGTRLVDLDGLWTCPVDGAGASRAVLEPQAGSWSSTDHLDPEPAAPWERPAGAVPVGAG